MPKVDPKRVGRLPVDPRLIERIQKSSKLLTEQGTTFMGSWGGPTQYKTFAKLGKNTRGVYAATLEGATTEEEIEAATGLPKWLVIISLNHLKSKGLIEGGGGGEVTPTPDPDVPPTQDIPIIPIADRFGPIDPDILAAITQMGLDTVSVYVTILNGATTEAEIVLITGLPAHTVRTVVKKLRQEGLITSE